MAAMTNADTISRFAAGVRERELPDAALDASPSRS